MRPFNNTARILAVAAMFATLAGCSQYFDRRDTMVESGGDSVATNQVTHMVDPWPRDSANRDIAFDGNKMEGAMERYRSNKVVQPQGIGTANTYQPAPTAQNNTAPVGPTVNQAPVK